MNSFSESFKSYFNSTHSLLYSYLISLPLLFFYELLIFISQPDSDQVVRISVDVWIKTLFSYLGKNILSITLIVVALFGILVLYKERSRLSKLRLKYFGFMLIEASVYAVVLALIISTSLRALLHIVQPETIESLSVLQQLALSLGAGLYEELFFRVILVSGFLYLFKYFFNKEWISMAAAIILAALLFSLAHYVGALGDAFALGSFMFRFLFGLALNGIFLWRGFGMAAWTHAIYDVMVVAFF